MNAILELENSLFAKQEVDETEQKLQESAARQQAEPLSNTYLDERVEEEERVRQFNEEKMNLLGMTPTTSPDHNQNQDK
jgi:hypothetical protein